jgi:hypothetical protein
MGAVIAEGKVTQPFTHACMVSLLALVCLSSNAAGGGKPAGLSSGRRELGQQAAPGACNIFFSLHVVCAPVY